MLAELPKESSSKEYWKASGAIPLSNMAEKSHEKKLTKASGGIPLSNTCSRHAQKCSKQPFAFMLLPRHPYTFGDPRSAETIFVPQLHFCNASLRDPWNQPAVWSSGLVQRGGAGLNAGGGERPAERLLLQLVLAGLLVILVVVVFNFCSA